MLKYYFAKSCVFALIVLSFMAFHGHMPPKN